MTVNYLPRNLPPQVDDVVVAARRACPSAHSAIRAGKRLDQFSRGTFFCPGTVIG